MSPRHFRRAGNEAGFFTIWVLGLCVCVLFLGGLSFDLWHGFSERRRLTAMVDAAAIAGASEIDLAVFRESGDIVLDEPAARQRAERYLSEASSSDGVPLDSGSASVSDGQVIVTASITFEPTLTRVLIPGGAFNIDALGAAEPARAESDPRA